MITIVEAKAVISSKRRDKRKSWKRMFKSRKDERVAPSTISLAGQRSTSDLRKDRVMDSERVQRATSLQAVSNNSNGLSTSTDDTGVRFCKSAVGDVGEGSRHSEWGESSSCS